MRTKGSKNRAMNDAEAEASNHKEATSNTQSNNRNELLKQLLPTLVVMQQTQQ